MANPEPNILGFAVVAALVTVMGNLIALYLKEFIAVTTLERWKAKRSLSEVYDRYRLPLYVAAEELAGRIYGLSRPDNDRTPKAVGSACLKTVPPRERHAMVGPHYYQYRFVSNTYRLCSFLGWIELYRRDLGLLNVEVLDPSYRLESCLRNIRSTIADGWLNRHSNQETWEDCLVYREELRAIGRRMVLETETPCVMDYGSFFEILLADPEGSGNGRWFLQASLFFDEVKRAKDFRIIRMRMMHVFLMDLMELLEPDRANRDHIKTALKAFDELDGLLGGSHWRGALENIASVRLRLEKASKRRPKRTKH